MAALARRLITLPLLMVPLLGLGLKPAPAATVAALEALTILARAKASDAKCHILSVGAREELSNYLARAEVAAARNASVSAARSAIAAGQAEGKAADCKSPATAADVKETLTAAREAIAAADRGGTAQPVRQAPAAEPDDTPGGPGSLGRYTRLAKSYYLERHCRMLSRREQTAFWKAIVRLHHATVAANGKAPVARMLRAAEAQANRTACTATTTAIIRKGYQDSTSR